MVPSAGMVARELDRRGYPVRQRIVTIQTRTSTPAGPRPGGSPCAQDETTALSQPPQQALPTATSSGDATAGAVNLTV